MSHWQMQQWHLPTSLSSTSDPQEEVLQTAFSLVQLKKRRVTGTVKAAEWSQDGIKPTKEGTEGAPKEPS